MAKSKLSIQLQQALDNVKTTLKHIQANPDYTPEVKKEFLHQWECLRTASHAMSDHLAKLAQREKNNPSVVNRLRNLKNVFKNKEDLARQREVTRLWYANLDKRIAKLWNDSLEALTGETPEERRQAVQAAQAEIERWKMEAINQARMVDSLDEALV